MSHVHFPLPQVYHQERVEEVRTEQRSSGGGKMASLNNNLSELDTLLQDLNNARYTGVFKGKDFFLLSPHFRRFVYVFCIVPFWSRFLWRGLKYGVK